LQCFSVLCYHDAKIYAQSKKLYQLYVKHGNAAEAASNAQPVQKQWLLDHASVVLQWMNKDLVGMAGEQGTADNNEDGNDDEDPSPATKQKHSKNPDAPPINFWTAVTNALYAATDAETRDEVDQLWSVQSLADDAKQSIDAWCRSVLGNLFTWPYR
jgi:hypothetical protein